MKIFNRLSWKLALVTGILVTVIVICMSLPLYWLTRNTLEDQLADHLRNNLNLLSRMIDREMLAIIIDYPESNMTRDSLERYLSRYLTTLSARSIYIIDSTDEIVVAAGDKKTVIQSVFVHKPEIETARKKGIASAPLYTDAKGIGYKSSFKRLNVKDNPAIILGIDADAQFLKYTEILKRRVIVTGTAVLICSMIIVMILSQSLTRPLRNLSDFARNIGRGRAEPATVEKRRDEIGFLSKTMEQMRREIDRREKENKALIASVAHEIRNPLAGMQINAELLLEATRNNTDLHEYSKAVTREITNLSAIVENFLAYARPIETNLEIHSMKSVINEVIHSQKRDFPNQEITLTGDARAKVNSGKIRHAIANILKNACEATTEGQAIEINIRKTGSTASVSILNRGKPIPPEHQSRIFEAFFSTKGNGVGLGLSIAKSIVEQHGGIVRLNRSDKDGTEFVIELPAG